MTVIEVMTRSPATCRADTWLPDVARLMVENNCGLIPVTDELGCPVGVITDRDIVVRAVAVDKNPLELRAQDCMSRDCVTVKQDTSIDDCCEVLEKHQIRRAIVVDDKQRVIGIVAQADLARRSEALAGEVVAAVSQPSVSSSAVH
jgi:CBS domain-containing protein